MDDNDDDRDDDDDDVGVRADGDAVQSQAGQLRRLRDHCGAGSGVTHVDG